MVWYNICTPTTGAGQRLSSTTLATDASGAEVPGSRTLYYPYGEERWSASGGTLATDYGFTGQRREGFGLMDYNARYYDAYLGRFISADTIVPSPGDPQSLNRYSYVLNSPLNYRDPTGHAADSYGGSESMTDCPMCEPVSLERKLETAAFMIVGVPAATFGVPLLGDIATVGVAKVGISQVAAAKIKIRLMSGAASAMGSGTSYIATSSLTGNFDWREFVATTAVAFGFGLFPEAGPPALRGAAENGVTYYLSSRLKDETPSPLGYVSSVAIGGATGGVSGCIDKKVLGNLPSDAFDEAMGHANAYYSRYAHGAPQTANNALADSVKALTVGPFFNETLRTAGWETVNNAFETIERYMQPAEQ